MHAIAPETFHYALEDGVATLTLSRPDRLNSLTFDVYRELGDTLEVMNAHDEVRSVVLTGAGRAFCSGGDVEDIIGELFARDMQGLVAFTRATGRLIANIRKLRRPVIAAVNGVAVGAGAVIALACDVRICSEKAKFGFIFPQVGLCGADMGAAYLLPRVVGLGHASELLFTGDIIGAEHALRIGLANRVVPAEDCVAEARKLALRLASGPAFAHGMTKQMLESEHTMALDAAIEAEAQVQAICMQHPDFRTAFEAWQKKAPPTFAGASKPWQKS
ncbi:enoyl-CoA hydratase family protein [Pendulispora albinea]|uniref:Enoyl-CoA hydratase family protein n=1 Tax=Pendulispora albinea TaxID=2741071 RepID=A0ABZ2LS01_9BACT